MPISQSELDEAVDLVGNALDGQENNLATIYQFSFRNSIEKLIPIVATFGDSREGTEKYREAVRALADWLQIVNGGAIPEANAGNIHFARTLKLRKLIVDVLEHRDQSHASNVVALAQWIVTAWGGVDRPRSANNITEEQRSAATADRDARYAILVNNAERWDKEDTIRLGKYERIAYWSKYLAFRHPARAAIFDSRVAYSLNWYLKDARTARLFPSLSTENRLLTLLDHAAIIAGHRLKWHEFEELVHEDIRRIETGEKSRIRGVIKEYCEVPDLEAYNYYLRILEGVSKKLFGECSWRLTKTEMLLFGIATTRVAEEVIGVLRAGRV